MSYTNYTVVDMGELLHYALRVVLFGVIASGACWCACYALYTVWMFAGLARRRLNRADRALRAEVSRGLADIERFLQTSAAPAKPGTPGTSEEK